MAEINLIAILRPLPGKENELRFILKKTAEHVRVEENGCFMFLLTESEGSDGKLEFKVVKRWANLDELNQHHEREWLQQMYLTIEDQRLLDGEEEIQFLKRIN